MSRILLVDDEPIILRTFASFLKSEGHETWTAARAAKAQSILRSHDIDVVVSDVIMPEMNGISLLELISRHWPEIRVILITGEPTPDTSGTMSPPPMAKSYSVTRPSVTRGGAPKMNGTVTNPSLLLGGEARSWTPMAERV